MFSRTQDAVNVATSRRVLLPAGCLLVGGWPRKGTIEHSRRLAERGRRGSTGCACAAVRTVDWLQVGGRRWEGGGAAVEKEDGR